MKPILYSYYRSSCSYRVRIALHLKKIDFEYKPIHLVQNGGEQHSDAYRELNPRSEVPFFITEKAKLSQSMAIIKYIDDNHTEDPKLFPADSLQNAKCLELCEMINTGIQPIQNLKVLQYLVDEYKADDSKKQEWCQHWISKGFEALEVYLSKTAGKYSLGNDISAVDCFLIPQVYNAERFHISIGRFPTIEKINKNCMEIEAFQKAEPSKQPDTP
jgi:maleylacetoacetate isomerase